MFRNLLNGLYVPIVSPMRCAIISLIVEAHLDVHIVFVLIFVFSVSARNFAELHEKDA